MTATVYEFDVEMTCGGCEKAIRSALQSSPHSADIKIRDLDHSRDKLVVETTLPSFQVQELVESTGRKAVCKGAGAAWKLGAGDGPSFITTPTTRNNLNANNAAPAFAVKNSSGAGQPPFAASTSSSPLSAAVAMMYPSLYFGPIDKNVQGVTRFVQIDDKTCVVEGTIDGLTPGMHGLHVHECGDLSRGCDSTGDHFNPHGFPHGAPTDAQRHAGDLGNVVADASGRASFRLVDKVLNVGDIIGRSLVVKEGVDDLGRGTSLDSKTDGAAGKGIACGIIARSAGLFDNPKKICACDGKTLWDERGDATKGKNQSA